MWLLRRCIFPSNSTMIVLILYLTSLITTTTTFRLITMSSIATTTDVSRTKYPSYWLGNGDDCYFVSDYLTTWNSAREFCIFLESDLVVLSNESIQKDVITYSKRPSISTNDFWIGLNDLNSPGNFQWVDESELMLSKWINDTDSAGGNCVMLDVEDQKWKVENCTSQYGFICSKKCSLEQERIFNESLNVQKCEGGMKRFENSCYWTVPGENNWQSAEYWCETENGNLTTISSSLENIFLYSFVRQEVGAYWIGLHVDGGLRWEAEQEDSYFNWDGQPVISSGLCAVMERNGKWLMQLCEGNQITSAICEKPVLEKSFPTIRVDTVDIPGCPQSWANIEDKCYLVVMVPMTWDDAHNQCLSLGGDLVSFKNRDEEIRVVNLVKSDDESSSVNNFWLGLRLKNNTDAKEWKWTDQSSLSYTNWNFLLLSQNVSADGGKFCAVYEIITGQWTIEPCSLTAIFVCEGREGHWNLSCDDQSCQQPTIKAETTISPFFGISTDDAEDYYPKVDPCPPEWDIFDDKCYLIKGEYPFEYVNWTTASYLCRSQGDEYDLVSIHSTLEHEFLLDELKSRGMERVWIGLNDKAIEGQFVWSDGSPVDYTDWGWQDYLNANTTFSSITKHFEKMTADCVKIEMTALAGKWNANDCNINLGYICQKTFRSKISTPPVPFLPTLSPHTLSTKGKIPDSDPITTVDVTTQFTTTNNKPDDTSQDMSYENANLDTDVTDEITHTWVPEAGSSMAVSDANEFSTKEVSPFDIDNLVTAKCKCDSESRMTNGTIAGITLSCILAVVLITIALFHWRKRRVAPTVASGKFSFDNALYNPHADHIQLDTNVTPTNT